MVRKSSRKKYTGFSIQKEKVEEIKKYIVEHPDLHYKTVIEFINDAIHEKINKKITVLKSEELKTIKDQLTSISGEITTISGIVQRTKKIGAPYVQQGKPEIKKGTRQRKKTSGEMGDTTKT